MDAGIRQWMGDPRGHWEGNTLVVETTNFNDKTRFQRSGQNMKLVERFTRTAPDTITVRVHGGRSVGLHPALDRADPDEEDRGSPFRVRLQ